MEVSEKMEDYLEAIYRLALKKPFPVRNKELASFLAVDKATAASAVKKLSECNLVRHEHYGYVVLSSEGEAIARQVFFKHRVIKDFLTGVLAVEEAQAEKEACLMEHGLSEDTALKMKEFLDRWNQDQKKEE